MAIEEMSTLPYNWRMALNLDDQATYVDKLDRANLLYEVAMQVSRGPNQQVIAVTGDWGSGKTSFLRQLHALLWPDIKNTDIEQAA